MISKKDRFNDNSDKIYMNETVEESPNVYSYNLKSGFE